MCSFIIDMFHLYDLSLINNSIMLQLIILKQSDTSFQDTTHWSCSKDPSVFYFQNFYC